MKTGIKRMIGLVVLLMTGAVQAAVIGLNTFSNDYVGTYSVTLSGATTNGFKDTYTATNATGNSFAIASAGVSGGPVALDVGKSAVLTYKFTSTKLATLDLGWRWGIDFGGTVIQMRADTTSSGGSQGGNFLRVSYVTANGALTNASGASNPSWDIAVAPTSNYWIKASSPDATIETTVTRITATDYVTSILWGGNTYGSTGTVAATDGTIDSVYFGYGRDTVGAVTSTDNFTISDVSLSVIPEPATISMLGIGTVVVMLIRRNQRV